MIMRSKTCKRKFENGMARRPRLTLTVMAFPMLLVTLWGYVQMASSPTALPPGGAERFLVAMLVIILASLWVIRSALKTLREQRSLEM